MSAFCKQKYARASSDGHWPVQQHKKKKDETSMKLAISNLVQNSKQVKMLWKNCIKGQTYKQAQYCQYCTHCKSQSHWAQHGQPLVDCPKFIPIKTVKMLILTMH